MSRASPRMASRIEAPQDPQQFQEYCYRKGWTDGLPIVPPTTDAVGAMLAAVHRKPDDVVAYLEPHGGAATVEKIAINATMAGCLPEYMPVLLAITEALGRPEFGLYGIQVATSPLTPLVIVNGPVRKRIGMNCGRGALGPGWRANATIGRAVRLLLTNIGGGTPGTVDLAAAGWPGKYTFCFGENEEDSPWEPLHVERGFRPADSAVTVAPVLGSAHSVTVFRKAESVLKQVANLIGYPGSQTVILGNGEPVVLFTPGHAKLLAEQGFSKAKVKEWLFEHAAVPLDRFPEEPSIIGFERRWNRSGNKVYPCRRPEEILIAVVGGAEAYHATHCEGTADKPSQTVQIDDD
ncbi:MAG: hypothetical protein HYX97_05490 [Chloroflexi bacterium]|nr:hypothetical protein [Chloroflexota bacterium]